MADGLDNVTSMSTIRVTTDDGLHIAAQDFGGSGSSALFVHAAGFCAPVLQPLARFPSGRWHSYAIDLRGHGASDAPNTSLIDWNAFAVDVISGVKQLGLDRPIGVGHSLGAVALLLAEATRPGSFSKLYCYEPPIYLEGEKRSQHVEDLIRRANQRRAVFDSRAQARERFQSRPPLNVIDPEVLGLYVEHGFIECDNGTVRLACDPSFEALIYASAPMKSGMHLEKITCDVTFAFGQNGPEEMKRRISILCNATTKGRLEGLQGLGHFGPMQNPQAIATSIIRSTEIATT
jgi:pimeloyl-ACP methyl ester carboxylesterase